jgi:AcrR family transcriptional regulator
MGPRGCRLAEVARLPLNRQRVLQAALRLVDQEGLESLSMRRLGKELGVGATALYNHVADKAAMLDGLVETVLGEVMLPPSDDADWMAAIRSICRSLRQVIHRHPNLVPLIAGRPFNSPGALRPVEVMFQVLCRAGFEENLVVEGQRALSGFVLGYVQMELGGAIFRPPEMRTDNHPIDIRRLPEAEFPRIRAFAPYLVHYYSDDAFERGLDVIFAGLRAALEQPDS